MCFAVMSEETAVTSLDSIGYLVVVTGRGYELNLETEFWLLAVFKSFVVWKKTTEK
jgi:hypothetical protein